MDVVAPYSPEPYVRIINSGTISPQTTETAWAIMDDAIFRFAFLALDSIPAIPLIVRVKCLLLSNHVLFRIFLIQFFTL